ncbi:MAG: prepilin-type N-terminal cleavage/methylation domain-containing protein [Lentisphaeria bacterium]|nr:prepilin-type N-terminal cleavage/methylation domain-containing protein [Lentisphaeria bacterium]
MKKRFIKHGFNMVEVALALAIIAIGISSILVLFPVGANANKAAIANNNLADIAEYMMSYIRAGVTSEWIWNADHPDNQKKFFTDNIKKHGENDWYATVGDGEGLILDWEETTLGSGKYEMTVKEKKSKQEPNPKVSLTRITENLYRLGDNRAFLFTQISGGNIDFAAVVKIWGEEIKMDVPVIVEEDKDDYKDGVEYQALNSGTENEIDRFAKVFCVEVSWPAQAPLQNRERRVFRQEFFNEAFKKTTP